MFDALLKLDKRVIEQQGILRLTKVPYHRFEIFGLTRLDKIFSLDSVDTLFADDGTIYKQRYSVDNSSRYQYDSN